jgi:hypothetical protein
MRIGLRRIEGRGYYEIGAMLEYVSSDQARLLSMD